MNTPHISKEAFQKIWNETLGQVEDLEFECSPELKEHLIKIANGEYTDEEIIEHLQLDIYVKPPMPQKFITVDFDV